MFNLEIKQYCNCGFTGVLWKWKCGYLANLSRGDGLCPLHGGCLDGSEAVLCECGKGNLSPYYCRCGHYGLTEYRDEQKGVDHRCHYCRRLFKSIGNDGKDNLIELY